MSSTVRMDSRRRPGSSLVAVFAIAAGTALPVWASSGLLAIHIALFAVAPPLMAYARRQRYLSRMWIVMLLWSASQAAADLMSGRLPSSLVIIGPSVALLVTLLHLLCVRYQFRAEVLTLGVAVGWLVQVGLGWGELVETGNPWKYGLAAPASLFSVSLVLIVWRTRLALMLVLGSLAYVSFVFDSRISAGILALAALVCLVMPSGDGRRSRRGVVVRFVGICVLLVGAYLVYPIVAESGALGQRALLEQQGFEKSGANFLIGARKEVWQSLYLVAHNPLTGIGAYSPVDAGQSAAAIDFVASLVPLNVNDVDYLLFAEGGLGYHPHSQMVDAVLFGGLGALPAWIFVAVTAVRTFVRGLKASAVLPGLQTYVSVGTLWSALFSPISSTTTISLTILLFAGSFTAGDISADQVASKEVREGRSRHRYSAARSREEARVH